MPPEIESKEWKTVTDLWTAAGWVKIGADVIKFFYEFGKTEPFEYALARIEQELAAIRTRLDELDNRVNDLVILAVQEQNKARIRHVNQQAKDLEDLAFQLKNAPDDRRRAAEAAHSAANIADLFLDDNDLWNWTDIVTTVRRNERGEPIGAPRVDPSDPDFKLAVAYPVYTLAIVTWLAGILIHTDGDKAQVQQHYANQLNRHIQAVSVRDGWRDDGAEPPVTIAERIRARITCQPIPVNKYAVNGQCTFTVQCVNTIERTTTVVSEFPVDMEETGSQVLCTISPTVVIQDEQQIEDEYPGIVGLKTLEKMMRSVASNGHLPTQEFERSLGSESIKPTVDIYGIGDDKTLHRYRQSFTDPIGALEGPELLGGNWRYKVVVSAGGDRFLELGALKQWRLYHSPKDDRPTNLGPAMELPSGSMGRGEPGRGTRRRPGDLRGSPDWVYFGGGEDVIYGLVVGQPNNEFSVGDLYWASAVNGSFSDIKKVGQGWNIFTKVFSVGGGVIYGVHPDGRLRWHRHAGYLSGYYDWEDLRDLNTGVDWNGFERIIGAPEGILYGVYPNGQAAVYHHLDWKTGGEGFKGPFDGGNRWRQYNTLFASMPKNIVLG